MKPSFFRVLTLCFIAFLLSPPLSARDDTPSDDRVIRFAPLPMSHFDQATRDFLPFIDYLSEQTGRVFELAWYPDYASLIDALVAGEVDIAHLGPLPYVAATQKSDALVPLVQLLDAKGDAEYSCSLVYFARNPPSFLSKPAFYDVALTQPLSTCGYLAMENFLQTRGVSLEDPEFHYHYSGTHEQVALDVIAGKQDIGSVKTDIARRYRHLGLRIFSESDPLPGFLLVANRRQLSAETRESVRQAMLRLSPADNPQDKEQVRLWNPGLSNGSQPADDTDYDEIRRQWYRLKISLIRTDA